MIMVVAVPAAESGAEEPGGASAQAGERRGGGPHHAEAHRTRRADSGARGHALYQHPQPCHHSQLPHLTRSVHLERAKEKPGQRILFGRASVAADVLFILAVLISLVSFSVYL